MQVQGIKRNEVRSEPNQFLLWLEDYEEKQGVYKRLRVGKEGGGSRTRDWKEYGKHLVHFARWKLR